MSMIHCLHCQTELFTAGMPGGRDFRCAVCGRVNSGHWTAGKQTGHRGAWRSLGLGIACLLALVLGTTLPFYWGFDWWFLGYFCLATVIGFPAVYLGLRALLRMRYQKTSPSTRFAAIGGAVLGGVFGILIGGMISVFGLLIAWLVLSTVTVEGPEASQTACQEIFLIDFPPQSNIQPYRVRTSAIEIRIEFRDAERVYESSVSMKVLRYQKWVTTNRQTFVGILEDEIFDRFSEAELSARKKDRLQWQMVGHPEDINRILWQRTVKAEDPLEKSEVVQYYLFFDVGETSFGIVLIHQPAASKLSEDDIRKIFESFRPAEQ